MVGTTNMTSLLEQWILERKIEELEMDRIADCLHVDGLKSHINAGSDELRVGDVIIRSPQGLKEHLVVTNCEGVDFGGFVFPYNILTRIQQRLEDEETLAEVVKHKKDLENLNMYDMKQ